MERWIKMEFLWAGFLTALLFLGIPAQAALGQKLPESIEEPGTEEEKTDWMEEYTDTDGRRGMLAIRLEVFEGFHGTAELTVCRKEGGREWKLLLKKETAYQENQELPVGEYQVSDIQAVSEGRVFDCAAEPMDFFLEEGRTELCKIHVFPASVYQVPYEKTEEEMEISMPDAKETMESREKDRDSGNGETGGEENDRNQSDNKKIKNAEAISTENRKQEAGPEKKIRQKEVGTGISLLFIVGLTGFSACAVWLFCLIKRKREGDV